MKAHDGTRRILILGLSLMMLFAYGCSGGGGGGGNDSTRYTLEYASLHTLINEGSAIPTYRGILGLGVDSGTVVESDVVDVDTVNSAGTSMVALDDGFYSDNLYYYDCTGAGACIQSGPAADTGLWASFSPMAADTYSYMVEMENGQVLSGGDDFPGGYALPCIASASMDSSWDNGDLVLSWDLPLAGTTNLDRVTQIRVLLWDGNGNRVLHAKLNPTENTITIPASVVADALALGNGTIEHWNIQTRAYDTNNMNYARGYSILVTVPSP